MKKIILYMSGIVMLALQANGQQLQEPALIAYSSSHTKNVNVSSGLNTNADYSHALRNQDEQGDDPMKSKTFSKSFSIDRTDKINLANIYGSITIKTWLKNEIKVDAEIKAFANSDKDAQELLDKASISATKEGDEISFKTKIEDQSGSWGNGSRNGKRWRRELKVYYVVYMPATNALNASQQYGNLLMDDYSGATSLKVQYGNLTTGDLKNSNNYISVQYGKATLQNVNAARIKHQYGNGLTLGDVNDLELEAQYTAVQIGHIKNNANIKHQYGKGVTIESVGSLNLTAQYTGVKLGRLSGTFTGKIQYGRLTTDMVEPGCKIFNVDADYSPIILGFGPGYHADFDVNTSYGSFNYSGNVTAKRLGGDDRSYSSTKSYSGQVGNGGPNKINIKTEYSSVTFK